MSARSTQRRAPSTSLLAAGRRPVAAATVVAYTVVTVTVLIMIGIAISITTDTFSRSRLYARAVTSEAVEV